VYNGNFDITRILDQSNLSVQRCRLIFWVECSVGGYLALAKTITVCLLPFHVIYLRKLTRNMYLVLCVLRTQSDTLLIERLTVYYWEHGISGSYLYVI
jgi:hypothetical protein